MEMDVNWYINGNFEAQSQMAQIPRIGDEIHWRFFSVSDPGRAYRVVNVIWQRYLVHVYCKSSKATGKYATRD